jgi:tetratricopeptide (TPR) repeat protein
LKLNQKINNQLGIASDYNIISNIYSKKNNIPTAIEYNKKALKIWIKEKEMYGTAGTYNNIGLLYHNVGNFEEAIKFYKEGLSIFTKLENKEGMAGSLNNLSSIFIKQRKYKLANLYLLQSLNISKEIKSLELMRENYNEFYNLEYSNGNYKMAIEYLNIYIQIKDSLANENNVKNLLKLQIQHEYDNKETTLMNEQLRKDFKSKIEIRKQKVLRDSFVGGFALMLILAGIIFRSYRIKQKANHIITLQKEEVEKQRNIVVHQKQEILDSIEYAKRIQTTILPPPKVVKK